MCLDEIPKVLDSLQVAVTNGQEPRYILEEIADSLCKVSSVQSASVINFLDSKEELPQILVSSGDLPPNHRYNIKVDGIVHGQLAIYLKDQITPELDNFLKDLCFIASIAFEKLKTQENIQHYMDRVEVLHELNQLIATNVPLDRVIKSIAREGAFRFSTDLCVVYLVDKESNSLVPAGAYGADCQKLSNFSQNDPGLIGQAFRTGGLISVPKITKNISTQLPFAQTLSLNSINFCPLEIRGESFGVLLTGFKSQNNISDKERSRLEEFSQAAAVAISNASIQEQIKKYSERLEELVQSRTRELEIETQRAEAANKAKSQFLANMSHELRTPLTAIVGYSSVMSEGIFGQLNEKQTDALQAIIRSSDHLKNLIDDVLNLSRIESGKESPEPKNVRLSELLHQSYKLILQNALLKGLTIEPIALDKSTEEILLWVDAKHIQQIMINLLSNAVKYTPSGGKVWIEVKKISDKVKIEVHDTGVGIPKHKISLLFERFERGDDEYSLAQEGTGIGLNLTKQLIELNGGMIGATSEFGKGSCFWIMVPVSANNFAKSVTDSVTEKIKTRLDGLSVLVVDDNQDTREVIQMILQSVGAKVKSVNNVNSALDVINQESIDIIITDLALVGESGLDLIKIVKSKELTNKLPCIVMSACAFAQDQQSAFEAGAISFIPKPFKPADIVAEVRRATIQQAMK